MNSAMGPIFNKKLLKSEICGSRKQYTGPTDVYCSRKKSQQLQLKKKKKKRKMLKSENTDAQT